MTLFCFFGLRNLKTGDAIVDPGKASGGEVLEERAEVQFCKC